MQYNFKIGTSYSFNTLAPALLGARIINARLVGIIDYATALTYINVDVMFRQIYPVLPPNTPDSPQTTTYYRFLTESGEYIVLAAVWINENTIEVINSIAIQIVLTNANLTDLNVIKTLLNANGFTSFNMTIL